MRNLCSEFADKKCLCSYCAPKKPKCCIGHHKIYCPEKNKKQECEDFSPENPKSLIIYDYLGREKVFEIPGEAIKKLDITMISGDEIVTVVYETGLELEFDSSNTRIENLDIDCYSVTGDDIQRWMAWKPANGDPHPAYSRKVEFDKLDEADD